MRKMILVSLGVAMVLAATAWGASTPTVVTGSASKVANTTALLHAMVNPEGSSTRYLFEYGLTAAYGSLSGTGNAGHGTKALSVQLTAPRLNPGTVYHYRIDATNKLGTSVGLDRTFTTTGHPPPGAITGGPLNIAKTIVTLTGTVVTNSQTTSFVFEYGTTPSYGLQTVTANATASLVPTPVSQTITALAPGTTFHYRLVASHAGGAPEAGADQTFTTIPQRPLRARLTAHTTPVHLRHKPYLFTTIGTLTTRALPPGVGCSGVVVVRFFHGNRSVAVRRAPLQANCTFSTRVRFRHLLDRTKTQLRVQARFRGNPYLRATVARRQRVRFG